MHHALVKKAHTRENVSVASTHFLSLSSPYSTQKPEPRGGKKKAEPKKEQEKEEEEEGKVAGRKKESAAGNGRQASPGRLQLHYVY